MLAVCNCCGSKGDMEETRTQINHDECNRVRVCHDECNRVRVCQDEWNEILDLENEKTHRYEMVACPKGLLLQPCDYYA